MADISKMTLPNSSQYNLTDINLPHSSLSGESGGTTLSLVTTGEKYNWNNRDKKVTQTAITTNANYELLFSGTADNTSRTETVNKCNKFLFNPSTGDFKCTGDFMFGQYVNATQYLNIPKILKADKLWSGSLSSGSTDYIDAANYNYLIIFQNAGSDTNRKSMVVPLAMVDHKTMSFQFHTESQFISFQIIDRSPYSVPGGIIQLKFVNRTSGGNMVLCELWGAN